MSDTAVLFLNMSDNPGVCGWRRRIIMPDEAKAADNTLCINEDFGKIWRKDMPAAKGSVPDVRGEIRQQVLREMI